MKNSRLRIVALPFYEVGDCLSEFFAEAMSRAMTLRPEPMNEFDENAICAYDWQGRMVGYVARHDQKEAWQVLRGSGRRSLRGHVCEVIADHKCVVFECCVETLGEVPDLYPQGIFNEWVYTGPVLRPTQEMVTLEYMMDEISERLDEYKGWTDEEWADFKTLTARFCLLSRYDLSGDMSDYRRSLCLRLLSIEDSRFSELIEELKMAFGRAGREVHGGEVLDYWMRIVSEPKTIKPLLAYRHEYDIEKVHKELEMFPESMFELWLEKKEYFVTKLLYMHIPRQVLWRLISGIAFYEAVAERVKEHEKQTGVAVPADGEEMVLKGKKIGNFILSLPNSQIDQLSIGDHNSMDY